MSLAEDTVGGAWGFSSGSWIHLDAAGTVLDDFRLDLLPTPWEVRDFDAAAPERLLVSAVWSDGDLFGEVVVLDTQTRTSSVLVHQDQPVGDLAATSDAVVFVSYSTGDDAAFTVKRAFRETGAIEELATLSGSGRDASVDVDDAGVIYIATQKAMTTLTPDGTVTAEVEQPVSVPRVAVSSSGRTISLGDDPGSITATVVEGGSNEVREILSRQADCGGAVLTVAANADPTTLEGLCKPAGFAWLDDQSFIVSIGDEGGAALVRVPVPPSSVADRTVGKSERP